MIHLTVIFMAHISYLKKAMATVPVMDEKELIKSYLEEVDKLRLKLSHLEVNSLEQRASDKVRKWRQTFNTSSSHHMERILNKMEKSKLAEVSTFTDELRTSLDRFKKYNFNRLDELDAFISKVNFDDEIQLDYIKFELDSVAKQIDNLHIDILVRVIDASKRHRPSTELARNSLEIVKIFELQKPLPDDSSSVGFFESLTNMVRRASTAGAGYYMVGGIGYQTHF
jgi:hypothetical protein